MTAEKVREAHAAGLQVVPWTANKKEDWDKLIEAKVDAIITDPIEVERLSIYNMNVLPRNPLNGARVKNTTRNHLLAGPITVLDGDRCFDMLNQFIADKPHLWNEDIGVAET